MIETYKVFNRNIFNDNRGSLSETFKQSEFEKQLKIKVNFVQDNFVESHKNVLRGLHYQSAPRTQGKYISVLQGDIFDVIVDIRKYSNNYGKWYGFNLSSLNANSLWVPNGFAHGFLTLSEKSIVLYKLTDFYSKTHDRSIRWDSKTLAINWPNSKKILLSEKDKLAKEFNKNIFL